MDEVNEEKDLRLTEEEPETWAKGVPPEVRDEAEVCQVKFFMHTN